MELRQYITILLRWWWLLVISTVLTGGVAYFVSKSLPPVYRASTTVLINQAPNTSAANEYTAILTSERLARTYVEMMRSRDVLQATIADLGLAVTPGDLSSQISVEVVRDTQLMRLSVEGGDPHQVAAVANAIIQAFIRQNLAMQSQRFEASSQSLQKEVTQLQQVLLETQTSLDQLGTPSTPELQAEYNRLDGLLAQYRNSYASLLQSYEQVRLAEAQAINNVSVLEDALPPQSPIRPQPLRNGVLAAVAGLMAVLGLIFLLEYLDDTVKTGREVERLLQRPNLGTIAVMQQTGTKQDLISLSTPRSPISEAFRVLRANIKFSEIDHPLHSLMVTSAGAGEGKSTLMANLAIVTAQSGKRVILVDADLRRPRIHHLFDLPNGQGLTTALLEGEDDPALYLQPTTVPGLQVMVSGPKPPNPAELLGSQRMADLKEQLQGMADVVFFDAPPLLAMADAALLGRTVDGVLLVVQAGTTRLEMLAGANDQLQKAGARLLGTVLNQVATTRGSYYYYYYYSYYSDEQETKRSFWSRLTRGSHRKQRRSRQPSDVKTQAEL